MNYLYPTAKIYKIVCLTTQTFYIGSTIKDLNERLNEHINVYNLYLENKHYYISSFDILKNNNYDIFLIENFPCNDIKDLKYREGRYQKYLSYFGCINKRIEGRTQKEYKDDNKEKIKEYAKDYQKKYKENNKEKLKEYMKDYKKDNKDKIKEHKNEIVICECGIKSTRNNLTRHKKTKKHLTLLNK